MSTHKTLKGRFSLLPTFVRCLKKIKKYCDLTHYFVKPNNFRKKVCGKKVFYCCNILLGQYRKETSCTANIHFSKPNKQTTHVEKRPLNNILMSLQTSHAVTLSLDIPPIYYVDKTF